MKSRRRRTLIAATAVVAVSLGAVSLGACSNDGTAPPVRATSTATSSVSTVPSASTAPRSSAQPSGSSAAPSYSGGHMVSLGDSYTAGSWTGPTVASPAAFCAQSAINYPRQVAKALGMSLSDASCNGARTTNVTQPQSSQGETARAQLDSVREDTRLVTIALGVNDNGLFGTLVGCGRFFVQAPGGTGCENSVLARTPNPVSQIPEVTDSLVAQVQAIKAKAPHAHIIVLGYPQVLPEGQQCPQQWPIAAGDAAWVNQSLDQLDSAIERAAAQTNSQFLDLRPVTADHTACADDPWFNGADVAGGDGATYHPRSGYMAGVANALIAALK